jgi:hypothetical protein
MARPHPAPQSWHEYGHSVRPKSRQPFRKISTGFDKRAARADDTGVSQSALSLPIALAHGIFRP